MMSSYTSALRALVAVLAVLPRASAHMALWHESSYGFGLEQGRQTMFNPMAGLSFDQWWFHGFAQDTPSAVMSITPGQDLTVEIACRYAESTYGGSTSPDACMQDSGAYHAGGVTNTRSGWEGNSEASLLGCALAIAYKPTAAATGVEDFTVMSVQERCVRQRDTTFAIPANLPACPEGGCTCAWFWQGKNSADEMYMTGFRCDVVGGVATTNYPVPQLPTRDADKSGPTRPMFWANDNVNVGYTPNWGNKPSYNSAYGWTNGAQTGAFAGLGGGAAPAPGPAPGNTTQPSPPAVPSMSNQPMVPEVPAGQPSVPAGQPSVPAGRPSVPASQPSVPASPVESGLNNDNNEDQKAGGNSNTNTWAAAPGPSVLPNPQVSAGIPSPNDVDQDEPAVPASTTSRRWRPRPSASDGQSQGGWSRPTQSVDAAATAGTGAEISGRPAWYNYAAVGGESGAASSGASASASASANVGADPETGSDSGMGKGDMPGARQSGTAGAGAGAGGGAGTWTDTNTNSKPTDCARRKRSHERRSRKPHA